MLLFKERERDKNVEFNLYGNRSGSISVALFYAEIKRNAKDGNWLW